ncbi:UNKNOWN [Stylonychia lemnae]|uniref:Uncharacterized protein n=1 Tax=Stylonychia lemnae TaxID=5949 RepID=A0A078BD58_STYLE|nr:UNKNOWN [Stylonychia lemnae]|eukprot:CDW91518.1 UNKNOWN [Stylonychia lemnae]
MQQELPRILTQVSQTSFVKKQFINEAYETPDQTQDITNRSFDINSSDEGGIKDVNQTQRSYNNDSHSIEYGNNDTDVEVKLQIRNQTLNQQISPSKITTDDGILMNKSQINQLKVFDANTDSEEYQSVKYNKKQQSNFSEQSPNPISDGNTSMKNLVDETKDSLRYSNHSSQYFAQPFVLGYFLQQTEMTQSKNEMYRILSILAFVTVFICCACSQCMVRVSKESKLQLNAYYHKKKLEKNFLIQRYVKREREEAKRYERQRLDEEL